ncbi:MAG: hypothetical protein WCZ72_11685 [Gemmobacter sp.]
MDSDFLLVIGVVLVALTIPAIISAFTDGRPPRAAALLITLASAAIVVAVWRKPSGYQLDEIPGVFVSVIGRLLN